MKAATARLYARQPSASTTSKNGQLYLQTGYAAAKKWLVDGLGFKNVDINGQANDKTQVFGHPIFDYANGQRGGPTVTYLQSALLKSNFKLETGVQVLRVERNGNQATGVTAMVNGVQKTIHVSSTGRVILSSGAIQSPSLLMHSGIGDPAVLTRLQQAGKLSANMNSKAWVNSTAIGMGLFDNPNTFIELQGPSIQSYTYSYDSPPQGDKDLYLQQRSGPYAFASETSVFWDTLKRSDGSVAAFQGTIDSSGYGEYTNQNTITLNIYGTSGMKSVGKVVLNSAFAPGPDNKVYYSNPDDASAIAGFIHKIFAGLPAAGLTPLNIKQTASVADIQKYITTYSQYAVGSVNHWSSSCRFGFCVNTNTVVVGMNNLHVVDASILQPLTVNPQFGVMVAAEKASELILKLMGKTIVGK
jgi:cellobiose dehydrogenase (acceptor)